MAQRNEQAGKADSDVLQAAARETVRAAATDLADVVERIPLAAAEVGAVAAILDRLSQECAEAAGMLCRSA